MIPEIKVLQINQSDTLGGAAIAGYRLHQGLSKAGVESRLLVGTIQTRNKQIAKIPRQQKIERRIKPLTQFLGLNYLHYTGAFTIPKHPFYQQANILNFHNLHSGTFNYLALPSLTKHKPAVFTLHDMWSFTGHCSYSYDCDRWKIGCGKCPYPETYPAIERDNTRLEWKLKQWVYRRANLTLVTPSNWIREQVKQSLLHRFPIHHIPNGIDLEIYHPLDSEKCRLQLGIPPQKKVLMFAAQSLKDSRKGGDLLEQALSGLPDSLKADIILLTIGQENESIERAVGIKSLNLGYVASDRVKVNAYCAADLFIFPTRADNLPLVLQESMACGTPMVSFKVGGVPDLVRPGVTGYLAESENADDFRRGIIQLLEDEHLRHTLGENCHNVALTEYDLNLQIARYTELYRQILSTH